MNGELAQITSRCMKPTIPGILGIERISKTAYPILCSDALSSFRPNGLTRVRFEIDRRSLCFKPQTIVKNPLLAVHAVADKGRRSKDNLRQLLLKKKSSKSKGSVYYFSHSRIRYLRWWSTRWWSRCQRMHEISTNKHEKCLHIKYLRFCSLGILFSQNFLS